MKKQTLILVPCLFMFVGCVPMISRYYSIEPKSPSINVLREGHSQVIGLEKLKLMPISYGIERDSYTVYFNTDLTRRLPTVFISATSKESGKSLFLKRLNHGNCGGFYDVKRLFKSIDEKVEELSYQWDPEVLCPEQNQSREAKTMEFSVFDENDKATNESIKFELRYNGWSIVNDAI